jgi:YgiT-type zinc finger domain-containing protein
LRTLQREFVANIGEGQKLQIPNIEMEVCGKCGEEILSLESARAVRAALATHTEQLKTNALIPKGR